MESNILLDNESGTLSVSARGSDSTYTLNITNGIKEISLIVSDDELTEMIRELKFLDR